MTISRLDEWKDPYKSSKNAYFVFRVMNLGCQLAEHGRIQDLKAVNAKWEPRWQPGDHTINFVCLCLFGFVWKCWVNIPNEIAI